jgi:pimeloyl-ACP methyl ester carboxylesterase
MSDIPALPGISARRIATPRLTIHTRFSGPEDGFPVLFVHGNASSATFWEETMLALPEGLRGIAPDLRGYGGTDDLPIDATRGCGDWVDDLCALADALELERFHAVGHSLGGAVLFSLLPAAGRRIASLTLVAPGSPYGFGGTRDLDGTPCYDDFAGSGGGIVNPEFIRLLSEGYRGDDRQAAPRVVMNSFYWKPPFRPAREEALLSGVLSERTGPERYPGDFVPSPNWPGVAPGRWGPINALSPKYLGDSVQRFIASGHKPPVLWVRGADDQIVADRSFFDFGTLGALGVVPGWPGDSVFPPQPMVGQTRAVLERYQAAGGRYAEHVLADCGHTPYLEHPQAFMALLRAHLAAT